MEETIYSQFNYMQTTSHFPILCRYVTRQSLVTKCRVDPQARMKHRCVLGSSMGSSLCRCVPKCGRRDVTSHSSSSSSSISTLFAKYKQIHNSLL